MGISKKFYRFVEKSIGGHGIGNLPFVKNLNAQVIKNLKDEYVIIDGDKMYLDKNDALLLSINEIYEKNETNYFKKVVNKGDIIIDVGANIGYYTLLFARLVGSDGKVYSFEPDPRNCKLLEKNVNENNYKNIILEKKAVSDKTEKCKFYLHEDTVGNSIQESNAKLHSEIEIESVALDDYFETKSLNPDFIKIDIEGYEFNALKGMELFLKSNNKVQIMLEYNPKTKDVYDIEPLKVFDFLDEFCFKFKDLNSMSTGFMTADEVKKKYVNANKLTNFICVK